MADEDKGKAAAKPEGDPAVGDAPAIADADDGNESRLTKGYSDNPDAPDAAVAQVEDLKED